MSSKKIIVALPHTLLDSIDRIAEAEHRNRSDLIREALRRYEESFNLKRSNSGATSVFARVGAGERPRDPAADTFADPRSNIASKSSYEHREARRRFFEQPARPISPQGLSGNWGDYRTPE
jgi:Arc/MetJ-type ribon-helix-helix transcriptional regulator